MKLDNGYKVKKVNRVITVNVVKKSQFVGWLLVNNLTQQWRQISEEVRLYIGIENNGKFWKCKNLVRPVSKNISLGVKSKQTTRSVI